MSIFVVKCISLLHATYSKRRKYSKNYAKDWLYEDAFKELTLSLDKPG